eukprot:TRINITY_DN4556_c0_g2_i1.p1 TRINITY_DN4556_c0_g2~~TRINITY_DN4556_c0_g2_i1.p1  ORF type:complete len:620 (-),score=57.16 TRINITY_DN4556_c0_g2_i1:66-1925(-)
MVFKFILLVLCLSTLGVAIPLAEQMSMTQLATALPQLTQLPSPWSTVNASDPCNWSGVRCFNDSVVALELESAQLAGTLPDSIGELMYLEILNFYNNSINSSLPPSLGQLPGLQKIYLARNSLSGSIPATLFSAPNLVELELGFNQLNGTIPDFAPGCKLRYLFLSYNELSGSIPDSIANLGSIETMYLDALPVDGVLPSVGPTSLVNLQMSFLNVTGPIPDWIYQNTNLSILRLSSLKLTGTISPAIANLTNLRLLHLGDNPLLTPPIPVELTMMQSLRTLVFTYGRLGEGVPLSFYSQMSWLQELSLDASGTNGTIPDLSNMTSLEILSLSFNDLPGPFPESVLRLPLRELHLMFCGLNGTVPAALGSTSIGWLRLSGNQFTGCFLEPTTVTLCNIPDNTPSFCSCRSRACLPACSDCSQCPDPLVCPTGSTCIPGGLTLGGQNSTLVVVGPTIIRGNLNLDANATIVLTAASPSAPLVVQGCVSFAGNLNVTINGNQPLSAALPLIQYSGFCGGQKTEFQNVSIDVGPCRRARGSLQYGDTSLVVLFSDIDESQCSQVSALSVGAIGGIVAGAVAFVVIVVCIILYTQRKRIIPAFSMLRAQRRLRDSMSVSRPTT